MSITRTRVLIRAKYGWSRAMVPFAPHGSYHKSGYPTNAPGYVAMCWDIPTGPRPINTVTLLSDGWAYEIDPDELKTGDAIGYLGPDSVDGDGGFIVLFENWIDHRVALTWEHHRVVNPGPDRRSRPVDYRWHAYRLKNIVDA